MKKVICLLLFFCLSSGQAFGKLRPDPIVWNIENIKQEQIYWCWAALAQQVIAKRMGRALAPRQCDLVNMANGAKGQASDCCGKPDSEICGRMAFLSEIIYIIHQYGGKAEMVALPNSAEELYQIMASGKALVVGVKTGEDTSHIYMIKGLSWQKTANGSEAILEINDPYYAQSSFEPYNKVRPEWVEALAVE